MTAITSDTGLPVHIRTSIPTEVVCESGTVEAQESPGQYITAEEYPALAEIWDNDADAVYDGM